MADPKQPQRSLWLQVLWKPVFRSDREKLVYYSAGFVLIFAVILPSICFEWSILATAVCARGNDPVRRGHLGLAGMGTRAVPAHP